jgi:uncharacterized protein (TIGR02117 family)
MRRAFIGICWTIAGALATVALYAATAFSLPLLPVGTPAPAADIEAYVVSNGVHTDLVLPVRSERIDWTTVFDPAHFRSMPPDASFVAIGWGDREFFLNTPEWRDLTVGRAVGALSGTGRSLMHVTWLRRADLGTRVWRLPLDAAGHDALVQHITATLHDGTPPARPVPGRHYGPTDAFFEARGAYDLFTTCNTWTGQGLRAARVPVSLWTPFAPNVVSRLAPAPRP